MWKLYSNGTLAAVNMLPIVLLYPQLGQRSRCFYYVFLALSIDTISSVTKLHDHQARPFWVGQDVQAFDCSNQYGNPSGHSLSSMGMLLAAWLDVNKRASDDQNHFLHKHSNIRKLLFLIALILAGAVAYSRLFLGVHSLNQVYYGLQLGAWFAFTAHYIFREPLLQLVDSLISAKETRFNYLAIVSTLLLVAALTLQIINYENVKSFENPQEWSDMLSARCGEGSLNNAFQSRSLSDCGLAAMLWGGFIGILALSKCKPKLLEASKESDTLIL